MSNLTIQERQDLQSGISSLRAEIRRAEERLDLLRSEAASQAQWVMHLKGQLLLLQSDLEEK